MVTATSGSADDDEEDFPELPEMPADPLPVVDCDGGPAPASAANAKAEEDNKGWWKPWLIALVMLALAGHIVWCLMHHMEDHFQLCTTCYKVEEACICANVRTDLLKEISELEAQLAAVQSGTAGSVVTSVTICGICGNNGDCDCKEKYDEAIAQNNYVNKLLNSGKCTGLCPEHCVEHETATATPKPTKAPTAKPTATATPKPTKAPTAKPTVTATPKPTATATAKPTATATAKPTATATAKPTNAPTACPHSSTKKVEGEVTDLGNGEWLMECYKVCKACGEVVDTFYRGGMNIDAAIPAATNSVEIEDDGEAGKPVN